MSTDRGEGKRNRIPLVALMVFVLKRCEICEFLAWIIGPIMVSLKITFCSRIH